ncbi:transglutaminase TgpA family protein [Yinghuangia seranimata]|uniref:transglutaminase TgpA family protein n=1 Tax=Yinghuangia seranimata TaxID=408067 RepID=UPI00248CF426|nr:DUF3488 and transglutaminase-like domain-containing protein [Yinghuangia seranimata]MDI2126177.1 DUF3488 and transglutaminase-like domain-containing protein [Yinghuangia seranimata]
MTGRLRMAVAAAFATTLTSSSLLPLVHGGSWIAKALGAILLVAATGEAVRRMAVPRPFIGTIQLVVLIPYLLLVLVPGESGPLPTPASIRAYGDLLHAGGVDIRGFAPPAPATPGIAAILVTVVATVAVLVDTVAVTYAQAAPAGLPLLALYSVPAALAESGLGWTVFLLSGLAYVVLLLAEGRERLLRWGRPLAPAGAQASRTSMQRPWARGGGRIALATLAVAVLIPAVVPMTANRLVDRDNGDGSDRITTINPVVTLKNELNNPQNAQLLTYTTNAPQPNTFYLRIAALDTFDGNSWQPSEQPLTKVTTPLPAPVGLTPGVKADRVVSEIRAGKNYPQNSLPLPWAASEVKVKGRWRYENEGRLLLGDNKQTVAGQRYDVVSLDVKPTEEQLRNAGPVPPELNRYKEVPPELRYSLSTKTKEKAGVGSPFEQAARLQKWFAESGEFRYDTKIPAGNGANAIDNFMDQKVGYCEQFASTMAIMARILGIPSRVAVGFVPGTQQADGSYKVGSRDAHAWPELYFAGTGWVRFEPTPSRGTGPAYTQNVPTAVPTTQAPSTAPSTTAPSAAPRPTQCRLDECDSAKPSASAAPAKSDDGGGWLTGTLIGAGVTLVVLLILAAPMLARRHVRQRRLGALSRDVADGGGGRDPGDAVLGAWTETLDTARDLGVRIEPSETPRQLAARLAEEFPTDGVYFSEALERIALAAEQVLYAPEAPQRTMGLAEDVRTARTAMLAASPRGTRFRATFLPASTFRRRDDGPLDRLRSGRRLDADGDAGNGTDDRERETSGV